MLHLLHLELAIAFYPIYGRSLAICSPIYACYTNLILAIPTATPSDLSRRRATPRVIFETNASPS